MECVRTYTSHCRTIFKPCPIIAGQPKYIKDIANDETVDNIPITYTIQVKKYKSPYSRKKRILIRKKLMYPLVSHKKTRLRRYISTPVSINPETIISLHRKSKKVAVPCGVSINMFKD